jgi:hypothetical protein
MTRDRWDETWHRLQEWTNGQAPSERLAAQLLIFDGYKDVEPTHPLGGPDGGTDISCTMDGLPCRAAVYFPRGQQRFKTIKDKFLDDLRKAEMQQPPIDRFIFVTNQELSRAERAGLHGLAEKEEAARDIKVVLYHLERVNALLDSPRMQAVRRQFLGIDGESSDGPGGQGGSAYAIGDRSGATGGDGGRGGLGPGGHGGHAVAAGDGSVSKGGHGGDGAQLGGIGGRGGRGPLDKFGTPSRMWGVGRGGRGGCTPEFIRLSPVLSGICSEYLQRFPQNAPFINAGLEQVPTDWLNQRLVELGEQWRVDGDENFRALRSLDG